MKDILTEIEHGKGAIKLPAKFIIEKGWNIEINGVNLKKIMVLGVVMSKEDIIEPRKKTKELQDDSEMWEGEVIFIPKRKFKENKEDGWIGLRADQKLCSGWGDSKNWKHKIFDKSK